MYGFEEGIKLIKYYDTQYVVSIIFGIGINYFFYSNGVYTLAFVALACSDILSIILNYIRNKCNR